MAFFAIVNLPKTTNCNMIAPRYTKLMKILTVASGNLAAYQKMTRFITIFSPFFNIVEP